MNLSDALQKATQILAEERIHPTVSYETSSAAASSLGATAGLLYLAVQTERGRRHPRLVRDKPEFHEFKSVNFDLLYVLYDQLQQDDRLRMLVSLASRITKPGCFHNKAEGLGAGSWENCSSELPLIAEFIVRCGKTEVFINALRDAALTPGLTLLLLQLEEMISLNFTLFTDAEHAIIPATIGVISAAVEKLKAEPSPSGTIASNTRFYIVREIPELCASIREECRTARYLYVKGELLPRANAAINQDRNRVCSLLEKLGFTQLLIQSLDEAEKLYRTTASPFELKSCLAHLRSFVEQLHLQACIGARVRLGGAVPRKWGEALRYLVDNSVLTKQEEQLLSSLYVLVSDTGVHPLIADREYARLIRNMSIECGLLLLTKLDKVGINLGSATSAKP